MGETTIEWTQRPGTVGKTWNVCRGCSYESEGCKNCYAARIAGRFSGPGKAYEGLVTIRPRKTDGAPRHSTRETIVGGAKALWNGEVKFVLEHLLDPLSWTQPCTVFTNSMSDMFHEGFTNEQIAAIYAVEYLTPQHTYQNLTKRAKRRREWFAWVKEQADHGGLPGPLFCVSILEQIVLDMPDDKRAAAQKKIRKALAAANLHQQFPLANVWEGVSVENQKNTHRIDDLLLTPASVRFISAEPLLGELDLTPWLDPTGACDCGYENGHHCEPHCAKDAPWRGTDVDMVMVDPVSLAVRSATADEIARGLAQPWPMDPMIDQVIAGCESGPGKRKADVNWFRSLRDQCVEHGVSYFLKQADEVLLNPADVELGANEVHPVTAGPRSDWKGTSKIVTLPYLDGQQWAEYPR